MPDPPPLPLVSYRDVMVRRPGYQSERFYALLRDTFGPDELEPRATLEWGLRTAADRRTRDPGLLIGRFGLVPGDRWWRPVRPVAVGAVSGSYLSLRDLGRPGAGVGALGHLVIHPAFRRGRGHGTSLATAFAHEAGHAAVRRRETLQLLLLEARPEAAAFWGRCGYRVPEGARYAQPALRFDAATGGPLDPPHPLPLLVQAPAPTGTSIEAALLTASVRALYRYWYAPRTGEYPAPVAARIAAYLEDTLLAAFIASLPPQGSPVPLRDVQEPPPPSGEAAGAEPANAT